MNTQNHKIKNKNKTSITHTNTHKNKHTQNTIQQKDNNK